MTSIWLVKMGLLICPACESAIKREQVPTDTDRVVCPHCEAVLEVVRIHDREDA